MNVGKSVTKSIDEVENGDLESAILHACNAVDGTAAKVFANLQGSQRRFTQLLRDNYYVLGVMGMPNIDLADSRFPIKVRRPTAPGGLPDLADVIYGIHRCSHGHGDELPEGFDLLPDHLRPDEVTHLHGKRGSIQLSSRVIFGLLAVSILHPQNIGQSTPPNYFLKLGVSQVFIINDWWGQREKFEGATFNPNRISVRLDFSHWMD